MKRIMTVVLLGLLSNCCVIANQETVKMSQAHVAKVPKENIEQVREVSKALRSSCGERIGVYLREIDEETYLFLYEDITGSRSAPVSSNLEKLQALVVSLPNAKINKRVFEPMERVFYEAGVEEKKPAGEVIRIAMITGLKPEKEAHYRLLHDNPWPDVIAAIHRANFRRFSIFLEEINGKLYLFGWLEYVGADIAADDAINKKDPASIRWWKETDACQIAPSDAKGSMWGGVEELGFLATSEAAVKPNIVMILADDMGWSDPGFLGGDIETPNLDRLALEGTFYPRFFNHAKCEPTRSSLLTGVHFHRQTWDHVVRDFRGVTTIAAELKKAGYFTACTGKWHLPEHPISQGFDRYYGLLGWAGNHFDPDGRLDLDETCYLHKEMWLDDQPVKVTNDDFYSTDAATDHALEFLKERPDGSPFFLYLAYRAPHWPLQAPEETIAKYSDRYTGGWDELRANREAHLRATGYFPNGWSMPSRDPDVCDWADWPYKEDAARCMAVHAAMVDRMDQQIGRLLRYLENTGELDNTLICFTSDNGVSAEMQFDRTPDIPAGSAESFRVLPLGFCNAVNAPFRKYKTFNANGGICSPLIIRWPHKIAAGAISHHPVNVLDMMPTFMEVAGVSYPKSLRPIDGQSLFSADSRPMFFQLKYGEKDQKAAIDWPWKAWYDASNGWKLFNLQTDPTETDDLAERHPEKLEQLISKYNHFDQAALADQVTFKQTRENK